MNIVALIHLIAFLGDIALIVFVIGRNYRAWLNWLCAIAVATFAMWSLMFFITPFVPTAQMAMFWENMSSFGWASFPMATVYFYLLLTGNNKVLKNKYLMIASLLLVAFLIFEQWQGNIIATMVPASYGWRAEWSFSPYAFIYYGYLGVACLCILFLNISYVRNARNNREKIQARLLFVSAAVSLAIGATVNIVLPNFNITIIPQVGDICIFLWLVAVAVGITRYGLMSVTATSAAEQILDTTTDILLLLDTKGIVIQFNKAAGNLLGMDKETHKGLHFTDLVENKEAAKAFLDETLQTGKSVNQDFSFKRQSGQSITALVSGSVVKDKTKTVIGFVVSANDITELYNTQSALRMQKELTERILDTLPSYVLVIRKDMVIELANRAFQRVFKKQETEIIGRNIADVLPITPLIAEITKVMDDTVPHLSVEIKSTINGKDKVLVTHIIQMPKKETLIMMNDVTEERNRQDTMYLTDRLAAIGEMASGIAHEINNPLTGIIGLSSLFARRNLPEDIKEDLATINSEALRCAAIVKNLLSFARRHTPERKLQNISEILDDVLRLRTHDHKIQNITVEKHISSDLPPLLVDYYQIQQVFLNIVLNAESAMIEAHQSGRLRISAEKQDGYVRINFADDGPGISQENLRMLFNPFFTTKKAGKGTGLGLSISYGIISAHNGRIYAESEYGNGAAFVIELPVPQE